MSALDRVDEAIAETERVQENFRAAVWRAEGALEALREVRRLIASDQASEAATEIQDGGHADAEDEE